MLGNLLLSLFLTAAAPDAGPRNPQAPDEQALIQKREEVKQAINKVAKVRDSWILNSMKSPSVKLLAYQTDKGLLVILVIWNLKGDNTWVEYDGFS
jgi:hypothetical protein